MSQQKPSITITYDIRQEDGGYGIVISRTTINKTKEKYLTTPRGRRLLLPRTELAAAMVAELASGVKKNDGLFLQLAMTAVDHGAASAQEKIFWSLLENDSLRHCPRQPPDLHHYLTLQWQNSWEWAEKNWGGHWPLIGDGFTTTPLPATIAAALRPTCEHWNSWQWVAMVHTATLLTSSLLAFRFFNDKLFTPLEAVNQSRAEELFQEERWGTLPDVAARRLATAQELEQLHHWWGWVSPPQ